jgi:hypothetical protein
MRCSRLHLCRFFVILSLLVAAVRAQGGPPFTWLGGRNPGDGAYSIPDFGTSYGVGDRIQLQHEIPICVRRAFCDGDGANHDEGN